MLIKNPPAYGLVGFSGLIIIAGMGVVGKLTIYPTAVALQCTPNTRYPPNTRLFNINNYNFKLLYFYAIVAYGKNNFLAGALSKMVCRISLQ